MPVIFGSPACARHPPLVGSTIAPPSLWRIRDLQWAGLSGLLLLAAAVIDRVGAGTAGVLLAALALVAGGIAFAPGALRSARRGQLGIAGLMTIAAVGAVMLGQIQEAAALAFLVAIAEALEGWSMARTRYGLRALLSLVPELALILRDGFSVEVEPATIELGDVMLARPGDRIATDGIVRDGRSAIDVSAVTGESVPVEVGPGTTVYAGSVNGGGALEIEVTARTSDNTLARVVRAVEQAQEEKGAAQRLADRLARPLVPGVLLLSITIAVVGSLLGDPQVWIERALVVLVAASPCALAIAVPVSGGLL